MFTVKMASKKWCPMSYNNNGDPDCCITTGCMWWVALPDQDDVKVEERKGCCGAIAKSIFIK
jgi:hypothetical protein